eukprot:3401050-Rhodomonas_salina.5
MAASCVCAHCEWESCMGLALAWAYDRSDALAEEVKKMQFSQEADEEACCAIYARRHPAPPRPHHCAGVLESTGMGCAGGGAVCLWVRLTSLHAPPVAEAPPRAAATASRC